MERINVSLQILWTHPQCMERPSIEIIERLEEGLRLVWSDKSEHQVSYRELLFWCPCAGCSPKRDDEQIAEQMSKEISSYAIARPDIEATGGYAIRLKWEIGCNSGIWTFDRLWRLAMEKDPDEGKPYVHGAW